jgi:DNA-binding transcriptional LysR family regulator
MSGTGSTKDPHPLGDGWADVADVRLGDIVTFLVVSKNGSVTRAARTLATTPSQVSKAVSRLEKQLGVELFARGARGMHLSDAGVRVLPYLEGAAESMRRMQSEEPSLELSVAAPSSLNPLFLPAIARCRSDWRVRVFELPSSLLHAYASERLFQVALTDADGQLPKSWASTRVGEIRSGLFGAPEVAEALGDAPVSEDVLRDHPFIGPVYSVNGVLVPVGDDCPASFQRKRGHQAQTMALALDLAAATGQLVFGPVLAARRHVERGELSEIRVQGWDIRAPLFVACDGYSVLASAQESIVAAVRGVLRAGAGAPRVRRA